MAEVLSVEKVLRIAEAGEAFTLNGSSVPLKDLIAIATAARRARGLVRFKGLTGRPIEELMQITVASQGHVILEDDAPPPSPASERRRSWLPLPRRGGLRSPVPAATTGQPALLARHA